MAVSGYGQVPEESVDKRTETGDVAWYARTLAKNLGTNPQNMAATLQAIYPELDFAVSGEHVVVKRPEEEKFKVLDSSKFTVGNFIRDLADLPVDILSGVLETVATAVGGIKGFAVGGPWGARVGAQGAGAVTAGAINATRQLLSGAFAEALGGDRAEFQPKEVRSAALWSVAGTALLGSGAGKKAMEKSAKGILDDTAKEINKKGLLKKTPQNLTKADEKYLRNTIEPMLRTVDPKFGTKSYSEQIRILNKYFKKVGKKGKKQGRKGEGYRPETDAQEELLKSMQGKVRGSQGGLLGKTVKGAAKTLGTVVTGQSTENLEKASRNLPDVTEPGFFSIKATKNEFARRAREKAKRLVKAVADKAEEYKNALGDKSKESEAAFIKVATGKISGEELEKLYGPLLERRKELYELYQRGVSGDKEKILGAIKEIDDILQPVVGRDQLVLTGKMQFGGVFDDLSGVKGFSGKVFRNIDDAKRELADVRKISRLYRKDRKGGILTADEYMRFLTSAQEGHLTQKGAFFDKIRAIAKDKKKLNKQMELLGAENILKEDIGYKDLSHVLENIEKSLDSFGRIKKSPTDVKFPLSTSQANKAAADRKKYQFELDELLGKQKSQIQDYKIRYDEFMRQRANGVKAIDDEIAQTVSERTHGQKLSGLRQKLAQIKKSVSDYKFSKAKRKSLQAIEDQINAIGKEGQNTTNLKIRMRKIAEGNDEGMFLNDMLEFAEDLNERAHDLGLLTKRKGTAEGKKWAYRAEGRTDMAKQWLEKQRALEEQIKNIKQSLKQDTAITPDVVQVTPRTVKDIYGAGTFKTLRDDVQKQLKELEAEIGMAETRGKGLRKSQLLQSRKDLKNYQKQLDSFGVEADDIQKSIDVLQQNKALKDYDNKLRGLYAKKDEYSRQTRVRSGQLRKQQERVLKNNRISKRKMRDRVDDADSLIYIDTSYKGTKKGVDAGGGSQLLIPRQVGMRQLLDIYQNLSNRIPWDKRKYNALSPRQKKNVDAMKSAFNEVKERIAASGDEGAEFVKNSKNYADNKPRLDAVIDDMGPNNNISMDAKLGKLSDATNTDFTPATTLEEGLEMIKDGEVGKMVDEVSGVKPVAKPTTPKTIEPLEPLDIDYQVADTESDLFLGGAGKKISKDSPFAGDTINTRSTLIQGAQAGGGSKAGGIVAGLSQKFGTDIPLFFMKKQKQYSKFLDKETWVRDPITNAFVKSGRKVRDVMKRGKGPYEPSYVFDAEAKKYVTVDELLTGTRKGMFMEESGTGHEQKYYEIQQEEEEQ